MLKTTLILSFLTIIVFLQVNAQEQKGKIKTPNLENTKWQLTDEDDSYLIVFRPNGELLDKDPDNISKKNDHWKQKGNKVLISFNSDYAIYVGKFKDENTISGWAKNERGKRWKFELIRKQ